MPEKNLVVVAGANGVSGRAAAKQWPTIPNTRVLGLSRRTMPLPGVEGISVDLLDLDDVPKKLSRLTGVTP